MLTRVRSAFVIWQCVKIFTIYPYKLKTDTFGAVIKNPWSDMRTLKSVEFQHLHIVCINLKTGAFKLFFVMYSMRS